MSAAVQGELEVAQKQAAALKSQAETLQGHMQTMEAAVQNTVHEAECCQVISGVRPCVHIAGGWGMYATRIVLCILQAPSCHNPNHECSGRRELHK